MAHLVSPTSFRIGKTFPWKYNIIKANQQNEILLGGELGLTQGLEQFSNYLLKRRRIFAIRGTLRHNEKINQLKFNLLYAPRMKQKPIEPFKTTMSYVSKFLFAPRIYGGNKGGFKRIFDYTVLRIQKKAPDIKKPYRYINKWITRRLFRGGTVKSKTFIKPTSRKFKSFFKKYNKKRVIKVFKLRIRKNIYRKKKYRYGKRYLSKKIYGFNKRKLSTILSDYTKRNIKVRTKNVFNYLAEKHIINFYSHQRHLWQRAFRNRRFQYANYFDIVNAFYLLAQIRHTEHFLLNILGLVLPQLEKLRKFFYFLDAVIKHLPEIKKQFDCFRLTINGKLAGGTKRTKTFTIGYGRLPIQTFSIEATNNFMHFAHRFGEFGVKLLMGVRIKNKRIN